ncbi:heterogeneous nuclear ribonucleoprotein [Babesia ovis]|uniref:Heterogeneous nuclear ribonucleoprotein n=1 Tax=Babesia ovis TaxID=5869 RepID=A0A9W5T7P6_BABOV|nr:heterogeneous nuclear ribonucleoprotein [Babesia ovis]
MSSIVFHNLCRIRHVYLALLWIRLTLSLVLFGHCVSHHRALALQKPLVGATLRRQNAYVTSFVYASPHSSHVTGTSLSAGDRFTFDPSLVKRRRRRPQLRRCDKSKEQLETDHAALHGLANLGSDHPKKEDLRAASLFEFISRIENPPQRKRLPRPAEAHEPMYDALLYLKGLPFEVSEDDVRDWLSSYDIVNIVLIKNENGCFTGDAYVRCATIEERDRVYREMSGKCLGVRYIPIYRLTESAYLEYYHTGFRREPSKRNHILPRFLVAKHGIKIVPTDIGTLKTGSRICGAVSQIYRNGVLVDCGVYETINGYRERVFCVLMRNRIARNVGLQGQQREWLRQKDLVLFPGIKLNLYVEKIRKTSAQSTFDADLWREHLDESFASFATGDKPTRSMVYLTMDSSVTDDKVAWWERRLVDSYAKLTLKDTSEPRHIDEDMFQRVAVETSWLGGRPKVDKDLLLAGRLTVVGNKKLTNHTSRFALEQYEPEVIDDKPSRPYHELVREFMRGSDVDKYGTRYHGFDDLDHSEKSSSNHSHGTSEDTPMPEAPANHSVVEPVHAPLPLKQGNADTTQRPYEASSEGPILDNLNTLEDIRRRTIAEDMEIFPRKTLFDECIKIPGTEWLLRRCDVPKLAEYQVLALLRRLGHSPSTSSENAEYENRMLLCRVIKEQGLGTGLDPRTLIAKGLYKVKQSKKKLKRIIELTKHLTGRRFTRDDLDAASSSELHMLAEESLRKFAAWDPPTEVKQTFVDMYGGEFSDLDSIDTLDGKWDSLKWQIVIRIYGEQSDIKEIVKDIENNDRLFGSEPGSSSKDFEKLVHQSITDQFGGKPPPA